MGIFELLVQVVNIPERKKTMAGTPTEAQIFCYQPSKICSTCQVNLDWVLCPARRRPANLAVEFFILQGGVL